MVVRKGRGHNGYDGAAQIILNSVSTRNIRFLEYVNSDEFNLVDLCYKCKMGIQKIILRSWSSNVFRLISQVDELWEPA